MDLIAIVCLLGGLTIGAAMVWFWRRGSSVSIESHTELEKTEAVAQQHIKTLETSRTEITEQLEKARADVMGLAGKLSAAEAVMPQLEVDLASARSERDRLQKKSEGQQIVISGHEARMPQIEENLNATKLERERFQGLAEVHQITISELNAKVGGLESENKLLEQRLQTQQEYFEEVRKQMKTEFENLANQILKARVQDLSTLSEKNLETILKPFQEKLGSFEKKVTDTYMAEGKERFALKSEVERLIGLGDRMTNETKALTDALRGDSKTQGNWGELVLERILEASGLTEGREYHAQKTHETDDGDRMRPDFRVDLPEAKHMIIDSKVSLTAYDLYCRAESDEARDAALAAHLKSIHKHIDDLGAKHYAKLKGVNSPEFVFAFIPVEPAYLLAMQSDPELSMKAWRKGVAVVTATTLMTSLKTVASIWRLENQNRNALEIANEAAKLYDKFCGFLEEFLKIGKTFEIGQGQYQTAMSRLKTGPGNVLRKIEVIRSLGASPKMRIKQELLDSADSDQPQLLGISPLGNGQVEEQSLSPDGPGQ